MSTYRRVPTILLVTAALVVSAVAALVPPASAATAIHHRPTPQVEPSVPGHAAKPISVGHPAVPSFTRAPVVRWPAASAQDVVVAPSARATRLSGMPVSVAAPRGTTAQRGVRITMLGHDTALRAGVRGVLLRVAPGAGTVTRNGRSARVVNTKPVSLSVDYSMFRYAFGGDWAARLRLVTMPGCATSTPALARCRREQPLPTHNDAHSRTATATVSPGAVVALDAAPAGSTGTYAATSLADAGTWAVSTQGGEFSWSYPFAMPDVPGGLEPQLSASYSSSSVDGQTSTTNNQPSWIGNGWDLSAGYVERQYRSCADDNTVAAQETGDDCWAGDNATISFAGHSGSLVPAGGDLWRLQHDDGTRIEHLTGAANKDDDGEYWLVTDADGTRYYFGRAADSAWTVPVFGNDTGEPCHKSSFAASWCAQGYRWNLDYVVDAHGNSIRYAYNPETNNYGMNGGKSTAQYVRGGTLASVTYGTRDGQAGTAPARVLFTAVSRCLTSVNCDAAHPGNWPDTPLDQECAAAPCTTKTVPTFWSKERLSTVETQVWNGSSYTDVDKWTLDQTYPAPGGDPANAALWLHGITRTGMVGGTAPIPETTFDQYTDPAHQETYPNRINGASDGLPPMDKFRIHAIRNESGGLITIDYAPIDCDPAHLPKPESNTTRCYPVYWAPTGTAARWDWFARYVVAEVRQTDLVGGSPAQDTTYEYGDAAWHYDDNPLLKPERRTWSQWRGFQDVTVREGDTVAEPGKAQSRTEYTFFRGMNGDHQPSGTRTSTVTDSQNTPWPDSNQFAGRQREARAFDGSTLVSSQIDDPWDKGPTATQGSLQAFLVGTARTVTRTPLSSGKTRTTEVDTTYNVDGQPTKVDDLGDTGIPDDDQCTSTTYLPPGSRALGLVSEVATVGVRCSATPSYPHDAVSDTRNYYDGLAFGATPTHGDVTRTDEAVRYNGTVPVFVTTSQTYDQWGRVTSSTDPGKNTTLTGYAQTNGLLTSSSTTNALNQSATTTYSPALAKATRIVDVAGRATDLTYDPLGRLTQVWQPGRDRGDSPNLQFAYSLSSTAAAWQRTTSLLANGNTQSSYVLYDGFLRPRQTQAPAHGTTSTGAVVLGRDITDTYYDSRGYVAQTNSSYYNDGAPSSTLQLTQNSVVPQSVTNLYDGVGRVTDSITSQRGTRVWATSTKYGGDHTDVSPPPGATPSSTYGDARGNITELRQYHGDSTSGTYDSTTYGYDSAGNPTRITDAAGDRWTSTYDLLGHKLTTTDPDTGSSSMTYDGVGNLTSTTDGRGQTLAFVYDALGRKTEEHSGTVSGAMLAAWRYDTLTNGVAAPGDLTASTRYVGTDKYVVETTGFDGANRPTGQKVTIPSSSDNSGIAGSYATSTGYLADGSLDHVDMPSLGNLYGETLKYSYDDFGAPVTMTGTEHPSTGPVTEPYVTRSIYGQQNAIAQLQLGPDGSAIWQTFSHDVATQRLTDSQVARAADGSLVVDDLQYSYDPAGNVTSQTDALAGSTVDRQCFQYDYLRRLTEAWATTTSECGGTAGSSTGGPEPYWSSYTYDVMGDRNTATQHAVGGAPQTTRTYHYTAPGQPHTLQGVTTVTGTTTKDTSYAYNASGDTTSRPGPDGVAQTLSWDAENHLTGVTSSSASAQYVYDADGGLLVTRNSTGMTLFLPWGELHVDKNGGNKKGTRYYTFADQTVAIRTLNASHTWLAGDRNGTSELSIDPATLQPSERRTDPFGASRDSVDLPGDRGFVGGVEDTSTGLTHLGARYYDPLLGRFVSADPLIDRDDPQQLDGYAYGTDNPATHPDPSGMIGACPDGKCNSHTCSCRGMRPPPPSPVFHGSSMRFERDQEYRDAFSAYQKQKGRENGRKHLGAMNYNNDEIWRNNALSDQARALLRQQQEAEEEQKKQAEEDSCSGFWDCAVHVVKSVTDSPLFQLAEVGLAIAGTIACPLCAAISVGMTALSAAATCAEGVGVSCAVGVASVATAGIAPAFKFASKEVQNTGVALNRMYPRAAADSLGNPFIETAEKMENVHYDVHVRADLGGVGLASLRSGLELYSTSSEPDDG